MGDIPDPAAEGSLYAVREYLEVLTRNLIRTGAVNAETLKENISDILGHPTLPTAEYKKLFQYFLDVVQQEREHKQKRHEQAARTVQPDNPEVRN